MRKIGYFLEMPHKINSPHICNNLEDGHKLFARLTINDPLDPPDAQSDDEADGVPGAAGPIGYRGGHHGGQGQHDDSTIKHLRGSHTHKHI